MLAQHIYRCLGLPFLSHDATHAVYVTDTTGHIHFWNQGAADLFGWSELTVIGQDGWNESFLFSPEDQARGECEKERVRAMEEGLVTGEHRYLRRNGSRFLGRCTVLPLYGEPPVQGTEETVRWFLRIVQDVTASERQRQLLVAALDNQQRVTDVLQSSQLPELPDSHRVGIPLAVLYHPIRPEERVGGDFYDAFPLEDGSIALFVGDASGKGLAASARATEVRYSLRAFLREDPSPASAVTRVNTVLCRCSDLEDRDRHVFTTLTLVVISPDRR